MENPQQKIQEKLRLGSREDLPRVLGLNHRRGQHEELIPLTNAANKKENPTYLTANQQTVNTQEQLKREEKAMRE